MKDLLIAIPTAATSPFALIAYGIAAVIFLLAGAKLRSLKQILKQIPSVPAKDRKSLIEVVTGSILPATISAEEWIRHSRNKSVAMLVGAAMILLTTVAAIALTSHKDRAGKPPPAEATREVAMRWLLQLDSANYKEAYDQMFVGFRETHTLESWVVASNTFRRPLGKVEHRRESNTGPSEFTLGRPLNGYTIVYLTKFENWKTPIREALSFASPGVPEPWQVVGYLVDIPPDAPFLAPSAPK